MRSEITYKDGLKEGDFIVYDSMAVVTNRGVYRADTIYQESITRELSKHEEEMPLFYNCEYLDDKVEAKKCSDQKLLEYIFKTIRYPSIARKYDIEGSAIVRFNIDKDGSIKDIKVIKGLCESIANECVRVVEEMPNWYRPGIQDGSL